MKNASPHSPHSAYWKKDSDAEVLAYLVTL